MPPPDSVLAPGIGPRPGGTAGAGSGVLASAPAPAAAPPVAAKPTMRGFDDVDSLRGGIYDSVFKAVTDFEPVANASHTVRLSNPKWVDPPDVSRKDRKRAILRNESLGRRLQAEWHLMDNATGQPVASRRSIIATVPKLTDGGTFVQDGIEYTLANQFRLLPGIYTRRKSTGETESHVNTLPGQGVSHRYSLDPAKSVFKMEVGQSSVPLLPVLRALGAHDDQLREAWGDKLLAANQPHDTPEAMNKLYDRLLNAAERKAEPDKAKAVANAILKMRLDPAVTKRTVGRAHETLGVDAILDSTKRLLSVYRGESDPDDRDAMPYQKLMSPDDLMAERIRAGRSTVRKLLWKATNKRSLAPFPTGLFDGHFKGLLQSSGLGQSVEEVNPTEMLGQLTRVTRLGEGGISGGVDSVPEESRNVHSSQLGYVDPVLTPESSRAGVDLKLAGAARRGSDGKMYTPVRDLRTGQIEHKSPLDLADEPLAFPGEMKGDDDVVTVVHNGKIDRVPRAQVRYEVPHMEHTFNQLANLVPGKSAIKGQRAIMGARMSVTGDTTVFVRRADGTLYRGPIESYERRDGDESPSIDKTSKQLVWKPVVDRIEHNNVLPVFKVKFKDGRSVKATADHSFVTIGDDGALKKVHTQDLRTGTWIPIAGRIDPTSGATESPPWSVPAGKKHNAYPAKSFALDFDCGWMHGLYAAEGYCTGNQEDGLKFVTFANLDDGVRGRIGSFFSAVDVRASSRRRTDGKFDRITVSWKQLGEQLREDFGDGSYNKKLPDWVFSAPVEYRRGVLGGYLAGDGIVSPHRDSVRVAGGSRSVRLRDDLCDLALTLGIATTRGLTWVTNGPGGSVVRQYRFSVQKHSLHLLPSTHCGYKDEKIARSWSGKRGGDSIPMYDVARSHLVSITRRDQRSERTKICRDQCTKSFLRSLPDLADESLLQWINSDVSWVRISSVEELDAEDYEKVYDLDMADNVFMCASGVFVHNTTQAMALRGAEARLLMSGDPESGEAYDKTYGHHVGAVRAEQPGRVTEVTDDRVTVRGQDGKEKTFELHNNLPYNRKSFLHQTATVQPGQEILPGDLLAKSNYTDDQGHVALGRNLYSAYLPDGNNFEDAVTISASAARDKMASEHLYQHSAEHSDDVKRGKNSFAALMPSAYNRAQMAVLDDEGVIKPGTVVEKGQPLVLGARLKSRTRTKILRGGADAYSNGTEEWDHHNQGIVTDVEKTPKGVVVAVKSYNPMQEGDKIAGTYGDKGLVKIVPDEHMPHDSQGRPFEVLLNPLGVQTRGNPIQVYEAVLSKIAKATGKPYTLNDFGDIKDLQEFTTKEAERHNIPDTETVTDPRTGAKIPGVLTGYRYMMKLHHAAEDKDQGRGLGGYGSDGEPSRGSGAGGGAKRFSVWDTWAMLSHGALAGIKDAKQIRGQKNEDYWAMFQAGHRPPDPDVPHSYKKFVADLRASGINPVRQGTRTRLLGMTNKDVDALTEGRTLRSAESVNWNEGLDPVSGGLFDTALTGSHGGQKWSAIQLHEPVLNPVFEDPARRLLGLTKDQLRQVMSGQRDISGKTGSEGLQAALKSIDVPQELEKAKQEFRSGKKTRRDEAVKRWALLDAADKHGVHPSDWMLAKVPVLPPVFRPVSLMQGNGRPMTADANLLYKELFDANHNLKSLSGHTDQLGAERLALYDAFKGVVGLGDPTDPKNKERGVSGVLKGVFGSSPKYGTVNRKLLGTTVDTVGRSVIVPNADLDMDQAGIPEDKAWDVFKPFVIRRLARQGLSPVRAAEMVTNKDPAARRALQSEMEARPVRITRAPILHRYGAMAFRPVLVPGHSIHLPPVVYKGFGADNDGDQVNYHVPVSDDAVREDLERLLPSKNLFNVRNFAVHQLPQNEFLAGLYEATHREHDDHTIPFDSVESVVRALRRGQLRHDQKISVPS